MSRIVNNTTNIELTDDNYYSHDLDMAYMSVSQFKEFAGTLGRTACEEKALTDLLQAKEILPTAAMLQGMYVDSYYEGTLTMFLDEYGDMLYKKTGDKGLKSEYRIAQQIINDIDKQDVMLSYLSGEKQVIMADTLFDVDWKIKMDSFKAGQFIADLKVMKDTKHIWSDKTRGKLDFIRYWGYDIQGAIYQQIVYQITGQKLPFYLVVATKEDVPDLQVIQIDQTYLDAALGFVESHIQRVIDVKEGRAVAKRCETCNHCKKTKDVEVTTMYDLIPSWMTIADSEDDDAPIMSRQDRMNDIFGEQEV